MESMYFNKWVTKAPCPVRISALSWYKVAARKVGLLCWMVDLIAVNALWKNRKARWISPLDNASLCQIP